MILSFDRFERYELPQVTLCNPNSRATEVDGKITITDTVGVLSNPKGMNLKLNFNAPHELSFDYYRHKSSDPIKQSFYDSIYEAIQTDRYIYLTDIGYFTIKNSTDSDENNIDKKSISLKSCEENEFATAEGLYLEEGTYYLHTEDNKGLIDLFLPKTAGWTIGFIDPSLLTKPYFVEETEVDNGYNFLYTTIQDMFECIVEPDIIRRTISVYSRVYYAEHHLTDIHIAKYNLLKHKVVEENDEDKYTALNVQGKDENLEIRTVNPTGKNVIYNFEPRYSWMSPALQQAIEKWQEKCESVEEEYLTLQQDYYAELELLFNDEKDIEVLKGELEKLKETKDIAFTMADGDEKDQSLNNVNEAIADKQTEIIFATSVYNAYKETVNTTYEIPIVQINKDCALDITAIDINGNSIFTVELLNELMTHIKPTDYIDEYMLVTESMTYSQRFEKAKELMDRAQSQLVKISSGQKTYSIDTRSFLFNKQFKHFSEQLCAGAIIYVETKTDKMEQLHLTGIGINFDEKTADFTLGNKYDRSDLKALYDDALGQNSKSFSELKYIAGIIEDQRKQLDYQRNWISDLLTLTLDNVLTSEDQAIEINNRGLIGRKRRLDENDEWDFDENGNPYFEDEQVKLIHNSLIFTKNNWDSAEAAIGKIAVGYNADGSVKYDYGMNGRVIIGELILGNNLVLTGTGAGIKIKDSNGRDVFYADDDGNLVLSGTIFAKSGDIGGWQIDGTKITKTVGNYTTTLDSANGVISTNNIQATGGLIGGLTLKNGKLYKITQWTGEGGTKRVAYSSGISPLYENATGHKIFLWAGFRRRFDEYAGANTWGDDIFGASDWNNAHTWLTSNVRDSSINHSYTNFYVTHEGELHATGATISGNITSSSGNIGGWKIDGSMISKLNSTTKKIAFMQSTGGNDTAAFGVYTADNNGKPVTPHFYVTYAGKLYANNAEITGTIHTTLGSIGGWTIGPISITGGPSLDCALYSNTTIYDNGWQYQVALTANAVYIWGRQPGGASYYDNATWREIITAAH